jgi:hypothetical protein
MKLTANVQFNAIQPMPPQVAYPVVDGSIPPISPDVGLLNALRNTRTRDSATLIEVASGWDKQRFSFKIAVTFPNNAMRGGDHCVVYGHSEATEELTPETKLYIDRVVGLRSAMYRMPLSEATEILSSRYDTLMLPKGGRGDIPGFRQDPSSVVRRINSVLTFGSLVPDDHDVRNLTGVINNRAVSANIADIDTELYCDRLEKAIDNVISTGGGPTIFREEAEIYSEVEDRLEPVRFEHTRVYDVLSARTNWVYDGFFTYEELNDMLAEDSKISVERKYLKVVEETGHSSAARRIFHDHLKKLVPEAASLGMEHIWAEWFNDNGEVVKVNGTVRAIYPELSWHSSDFEDFLTPEEAELEVRAKKPTSADLREYYGVSKYRVKIDMDLAGRIVGMVQLNEHPVEVFVMPAYALPVCSGLIGDERSLDNICQTVKWMVSSKYGL